MATTSPRFTLTTCSPPCVWRPGLGGGDDRWCLCDISVMSFVSDARQEKKQNNHLEKLHEPKKPWNNIEQPSCGPCLVQFQNTLKTKQHSQVGHSSEYMNTVVPWQHGHMWFNN